MKDHLLNKLLFGHQCYVKGTVLRVLTLGLLMMAINSCITYKKRPADFSKVLDRGPVKVFDNKEQVTKYNSLTLLNGELVGITNDGFRYVDTVLVDSIYEYNIQFKESASKIKFRCLDGRTYKGFLIKNNADSIFFTQEKPKNRGDLPPIFGLAISEIDFITWKNKNRVGQGAFLGVMGLVIVSVGAEIMTPPPPPCTGICPDIGSDMAGGIIGGALVGGALIGSVIGAMTFNSAVISGDKLNYLKVKHRLYKHSYSRK